LGSEIESVSRALVDCAFRTLPLVNGKRKRVWRDRMLSDLSAQSRKARKVWVEAGHPQSGELFEKKKCQLRRDVRKWVRFV
jgi:hypothetical protein